MKKVVKFTVLAVFAFITGLNVYKAQTEVQLSEAQMKNVEALANEEQNPNCDNRSGYRKWYAKPVDKNDVEETFYDCCYVLRYGYRPNTECNY